MSKLAQESGGGGHPNAAGFTQIVRIAPYQQPYTQLTPSLDFRPMRALTLTQPWASLIALLLKTYETRSWRTATTRGPLLIHASREVDWRFINSRHRARKLRAP